MESFLKDTPLESTENKKVFRSFIEPKEIPAADSNSATEEDKSDSIPDSSAEEVKESASPTESPDDPIAETAAEEVPQGDDLNAPEPTATSDDADPVPVAEDPVSEIVFEQVEGPKVEVISENGDVTKIIVHLAPDKILELKCEY